MSGTPLFGRLCITRMGCGTYCSTLFTWAILVHAQRFLCLVELSVAMSLVGCAPPNQYIPPKPPTVTVAKPVIQTVVSYMDETGTTEAVERVEIRARVRGFLDEVLFQDGQDVEAGQKLYSIQPQEYLAGVAAAKANLESMKVALALAETELRRQEGLLTTKAISQSEYDQVKAERDAAQAARDAANASLQQAELNLSYCSVSTPIAGRVERTLVKRGNLVGENEATLLTTVVAYDPIYVHFSINERALLEATQRRQAEGRARVQDVTHVRAFVGRATDPGFPFAGNLDYLDLGVDESSGTFRIRAVFANPELELIPGLFVRIRIPTGTIENAVLIPQRCLAADQSGRYVLILGTNQLVERRLVEVGSKHGELVVISSGLTGDETVIIDGIQRARPGGQVTPTEIPLPAGEGEIVERIDSRSEPGPNHPAINIP